MKVIVIILIIMIPLASGANDKQQERKLKKFEIELGGGSSFAANKRGADEVISGLVLYVEGRYNFSQIPVNVGLQINQSGIKRRWNLHDDENTYNTSSVIVVSDYSFRRGKRVNPFVGLGMGISSNSIQWQSGNGELNACLMPRVGIRFFRHISLALDYKLGKKNFSHAELKLGFYF